MYLSYLYKAQIKTIATGLDVELWLNVDAMQ